jgi:hypothetical protein
VLQRDKFEEKDLDENFKQNIAKIIDDFDIQFNIVDLVTTRQAKLLLDFSLITGLCWPVKKRI